MTRKRVLVVEDDRSIREGIADALAFQGYAAVQAERGDVGLDKALHGGCDLVLLDLVLPGADGLAVLREIRRARPTLPVIILTARGDEKRPRARPARGRRRLRGEAVQHPELLARVDAVLRRSPERPADVATAATSRRPRGPREARGALRGRRALASSRSARPSCCATSPSTPAASCRATSCSRASGASSPAPARDAHDRRARGAAAREAARPRPGAGPAGDGARPGLPLDARPRTHEAAARLVGLRGLRDRGGGGAGLEQRTVLRLERAERAARGQAALEENARLALWRMDSSLTPLLAQESARPYFHYRAFYPAAGAYSEMFVEPRPGEALVPSPLLREPPPYVLLHFQLAPGGELTSPQVPAGPSARWRSAKVMPRPRCWPAAPCASRELQAANALRADAASASRAERSGPASRPRSPRCRAPAAGQAVARAEAEEHAGIRGAPAELLQHPADAAAAGAAVGRAAAAAAPDVEGGAMTPLWIGRRAAARAARARGRRRLRAGLLARLAARSAASCSPPCTTCCRRRGSSRSARRRAGGRRAAPGHAAGAAGARRASRCRPRAAPRRCGCR